MKLSIVSLCDKTTHQLHSIVEATGQRPEQFFGWINRKRFNAKSLVRKITTIQNSRAHNEFAQHVKDDLFGQKESAKEVADMCDQILETMGYTPPTHHRPATKDKIEEMFLAAIREGEQIAFTEEFGEE